MPFTPRTQGEIITTAKYNADHLSHLGLPFHVVTAPPYNTVGNDTADDMVAVQSAITAAVAAGGGIIFFPPGIYRTSGPLVIPSNGHCVELVGLVPRIGTAGGGDAMMRSIS